MVTIHKMQILYQWFGLILPSTTPLFLKFVDITRSVFCMFIFNRIPNPLGLNLFQDVTPNSVSLCEFSELSYRSRWPVLVLMEVFCLSYFSCYQNQLPVKKAAWQKKTPFGPQFKDIRSIMGGGGVMAAGSTWGCGNSSVGWLAPIWVDQEEDARESETRLCHLSAPSCNSFLNSCTTSPNSAISRVSSVTFKPYTICTQHSPGILEVPSPFTLWNYYCLLNLLVLGFLFCFSRMYLLIVSLSLFC